MIASSLTSPAAIAAPESAFSSRSPDEGAELALIHAAQSGCSSSFRHLVESHQQRVYHFCFQYLRDSGDAREACQDTFIRAHRGLPGFRPKARLSTWLFQIALNLCRDRAKSRARTHPTSFLDGPELDLPCGRATPEEAAIRQADLAKLDRGLAALSLKFREVLVLSCLEGLNHAECAAILKCSERAVEGRLYRAREKLSAWWEREGS
ncbi:RNA polymerase sigma factor [Haloferula sp. BvORR071]|uniref:RNA polymerase sigma factor n=1 Tax=Haloferula sp. BvORR071 TaxID=1396141 RepID=UPI0006975E20|nr:RNA polymerase sigma factor [Haloferula sp. BvORR071]